MLGLGYWGLLWLGYWDLLGLGYWDLLWLGYWDLWFIVLKMFVFLFCCFYKYVIIVCY